MCGADHGAEHVATHLLGAVHGVKLIDWLPSDLILNSRKQKKEKEMLTLIFRSSHAERKSHNTMYSVYDVNSCDVAVDGHSGYSRRLHAV